MNLLFKLLISFLCVIFFNVPKILAMNSKSKVNCNQHSNLSLDQRIDRLPLVLQRIVAKRFLIQAKKREREKERQNRIFSFFAARTFN